jgi:hypothetical protein
MRRKQRNGDMRKHRQIDVGSYRLGESDLVSQQHRDASVGKATEVFSSEQHFTTGGSRDAPSDTQKRRLALRALRQHRHQFPRVDIDRYV